MEINLSKAVNQFFPNPSLEMVYFEAVANSIDAGANIIDIIISIDSFSEPETLRISIEDNGIGFTKKNFEKFSKLLETEEKDHKGLGRLVFLNYFNRVEIKSLFEGHKLRSFTFDDSFKGKSNVKDVEEKFKGTQLFFSGYKKSTIKTYDYIKPSYLKKALELHFFPYFHSLKIQKKELKINIKVETKEESPSNNFYNDKKSIIISQLPDLKTLKFKEDSLDLFDEFELYYSVERTMDKNSAVTAICAENRTIDLDLLPEENLPQGYESIFLLYSESFDGRVNNTRQGLDIDDSIFQQIKTTLVEKINDILIDEIPSIKDRNESTKESLENRYPHLAGLFNDKTIGLIDRNNSLENAQKDFFREQKKILEASSIDDIDYDKSIEVSSRLLTEYILYRKIIIEKLRTIDITDNESRIHDLIVPMKRKLSGSKIMDDIYSNNVWLLDDKYMTYSTILSDKRMDELLSEILLEHESIDDDSSRPDIAIVFSHDPKNSKPIDLVIVELKKMGLGLAKKEEVESQLRQRARKIGKYYDTDIQRVWYYGIVDFDDEFKISLKEMGFKEFYSEGTLMYAEKDIIIDDENDVVIPTSFYIMSYEALLNDAEARNSTFLNILKEGIKKIPHS